MITEQRIASFQQAIKTVTEHEFFHVLQSMKDPKMHEKILSKKRGVDKLLFVLATLPTALNILPAAMGLTPELKAAGILLAAAVSLPVFGVIAYIKYDVFKRIERDAYKAQKQALGLDLKSPFNFVHETTPSRSREE